MEIKGWRRGDLCMQTRRIATRSGKIREKREKERKEIKSNENRETRFSV